MSPDLSAYTALLGVDVETVKKVFASWGPGKFDALLNLDGKAFRPDGKSAATLIPEAFGHAGHNQHTWKCYPFGRCWRPRQQPQQGGISRVNSFFFVTV